MGIVELRLRHDKKRFLMIVEGRRCWMTFTACYRALDSGFVRVQDGALAIDLDGTGEERPLTEEEKRDITYAADEYSAAK